MGGYGSGRHWRNVKGTTSQYCQLDVRLWHRDRLLRAGRTFDSQWTRAGQQLASIKVTVESGRAILSYGYRVNDGDAWKPTSYAVRIEWTRCNYGGTRPWFRCPAMGCNRRVRILYLAGEIFACRHCHSLAYTCQREPNYSRAINRAQAIHEKLGGTGNLFMPFPQKPKGMHWRTYHRLRLAHEQAYARSWPPFLKRFN